MDKHGRIAFITTPRFRDERHEDLRYFVFHYMYAMCQSFDVMTTGGTYLELKKLVELPFLSGLRFESDHRFPVNDENALDRWRSVILGGLQPTMPSVRGMIHVAYELVEGRLAAVIHLSDWRDKSAKPDSAVLAREANVHGVPIANDVETACAYMRSWNAFFTIAHSNDALFRERGTLSIEASPISNLGDGNRVIAMIAHDKMKLEMCRLAVEHASYIFNNYNYVLATGNTGSWILRFMAACNRGEEAKRKIRICKSGPDGGDLQIAYAVVNGWCTKVIFLQDPSASHAHDSDIRLFEQAVASRSVKVALATNSESARFLIGLPTGGIRSTERKPPDAILPSTDINERGA